MTNIQGTLNIGLIGSGFMGKCHTNAFHSYAGLFNSPVTINLHTIADINSEMAKKSAKDLGFENATSNWKTLVDHPEIDLVSITAPNALHEEIALRAIANGKIVYCEKPLSTTSASARIMMQAAEAANITTMVGFNFLRNPLIEVCKQMIEAGELGEITSFNGRHAENYMLDPNQPHSFRTAVEGGGAMADIGSHIISMARYLLGNITSVCAHSITVHKYRPTSLGSNELKPVLVDYVAHALLQFESGVVGSIDVNWLATGRTMDLSFEITGTKGAIAFSQERMNELRVWEAGKSAGYSGFKKLETGPDHKPYGSFCPAAGHHLGFNDLKIIEVSQIIDSLNNGTACHTDFREGYKVQCTIDAILKAATSRQWRDVEDL